jgi:hypothetical protein
VYASSSVFTLSLDARFRIPTSRAAREVTSVKHFFSPDYSHALSGRRDSRASTAARACPTRVAARDAWLTRIANDDESRKQMRS